MIDLSAIHDAYVDAYCEVLDAPHDGRCPAVLDFDEWLAEHDFAVKAKALRDAADAIERLARETTRVRVTEHVLVDVGAPGVLREYARLFTEGIMRANDIPSTDAIRWGYGEHYLGDILFSDPDEIRAENVYLFDQWLAKHEREVKAEAWAEGHGEPESCCGLCPRDYCPWDNGGNGPKNPYTEGS